MSFDAVDHPDTEPSHEGTEGSIERILVIDNYDSFVYNLAQYVGEFVSAVRVERNDAITIEAVRGLNPDGIVVSPGPGTPADAGISRAIFEELRYPTLGVCLGHQALCAVHGTPVSHAPTVVHGKTSRISHDGQGIFSGLPETLRVGRYHSLAVDREHLPTSLIPTASTATGDEEDRIVMAVRHRNHPHIGVQFHPESVLTDHGGRLVQNFLTLVCDAE